MDFSKMLDTDVTDLFQNAAVELMLRQRLSDAVKTMGVAGGADHRKAVAQMGDAADEVFAEN